MGKVVLVEGEGRWGVGVWVGGVGWGWVEVGGGFRRKLERVEGGVKGERVVGGGQTDWAERGGRGWTHTHTHTHTQKESEKERDMERNYSRDGVGQLHKFIYLLCE